MRGGIFVLLFFCWIDLSFSQSLTAGFPVFEENLRRNQIAGFLEFNQSFSFRPVSGNFYQSGLEKDSVSKKVDFGLMPLMSVSRFNSNRPIGWGDYGMIPSKGIQSFLSAGFYGKLHFIYLQFQPEFVVSQNAPFEGFSEDFSNFVNNARFRYWNYGDYPERFGDNVYTKFFWGQSSLTFRFKSFELGASTKSLWWGPGQWNSLIFSNNAPSFPHFTLNTHKPAKTFLGNFEFQLLVGRLEDSGFEPTQSERLNQRYFIPLNGDWKYLNGLMISYSPKWVSNLNFGFSRTFQRYSENEFNTFRDYFPVFEGIQKVNFFSNGNAVEYDSDGYDQQFSIFARYYNIKAKGEVYFEYGRRDHSFNFRELILNPEHARAYILGFQKILELPSSRKLVQIRGEITQQQESINRYIRYPGLLGGNTWHTHHQARGFSNFGQALGVGIGVGSNVQTLEVSLVEKFNKMGILLERLENHQNFYYSAFGQQRERKPWVDLSFGFLFDKQWNNLILSSKLQLINGMNYQWQLHENSTPDFPQGKNLFSIHSQLSLIYLPNNLLKGSR